MQRKKAEKSPKSPDPEKRAAANAPSITPAERSARRTVILLALAGGLLTWASLPPWGLWPLGWLAPIPWLLIARLPELPGQRPYRTLYFCGVAYWLLQLQFVRLPHWAAWFGWLVLAAYLAAYLPLLVLAVRVLRRQFKLPLVFAAPIAFTGLELLRGHLFTGLSIALLAHSQSEQLATIQIADLGGAYAVTFVMTLFAGAVASAAPWPTSRTLWPLGVAAAAVLATLGYGAYRLGEVLPADERVLHVAIIQSNLDTIFGDTFEHIEATYKEYHGRTLAVARAHPELDVIIWPESMFTMAPGSFQASFADDFAPPPQIDPKRVQEFKVYAEGKSAAAREALASAVNVADDHAATRHAALVVGGSVTHFGPQNEEHYNSAIFIGPHGEMAGRYDKMHPVMFGEYVPLGDVLPWLYTLTPMGDGLTPGKDPRAFEIAGLKLSPSICFESTVPHLIRGQVAELAAAEKAPDMLVNVTNDGWFWGSSVLDLHLRCNVFRAVETRRPMLVAANTGFSAVIDGNGRILERGPRRKSGEIVAAVKPDGRPSLYVTLGDWPWLACLALCAVACLMDWRRKQVATHGEPGA